METTNTSYFNERIAEIGIQPEEAIRHGLREDEHGNIEQIIRHFNSEPVRYLDRSGRNRKKLATIQNRKTFTEGSDIDQYYKELAMVRWHPDFLRRRPDLGKYKFPSKAKTGYSVLPMPTNTAIDAYKAGKTGGTIVSVEGYFKAVSMAVAGVESVAFTGITTYKICSHLADYLKKRQPENFVILYDADARELKQKENAATVDGRRVFDFYKSALNFARQFHNFCKKNDLEINLYFAMVAEGAIHKGVDDLMAAGDAQHIMADLLSLKPSPHFHVLKLGKTTFKRNLTNFFGVVNHRQFYRYNANEIGAKPFNFGGATYQFTLPERHFNLFESGNGHHYFRLLDDPFRVELDVEELTVDKYMAEQQNNIDNKLKLCNKLCIEAPTGSGKTSFFLGYRVGRKKKKGWFERTGTRGVVAVPYISIAKQLAKKCKATRLSGYVTNKQKEAALNAQMVVCTYDTLHHLTDLKSRVLVVDECHDLVNQYGEIKKNRPFRAKVNRYVVSQFDVAAKTVLISGTPPKLLAKAMDFKYIQIERRQNNMVNLYTMEAENGGNNALTTAVLAELQRINFAEDHIHFVYFNSKKQLEKIQKYMVDGGHLAAEDISIITRDHVDSGHRVFNDIVEREEITGVKLVLSTCLIAEGININNRNIGNIYTVAINCPDSFRQYVARFRNMPSVDVYDIRPPERRMEKQFHIPAMDSLESFKRMAAMQLEAVEGVRKAAMADYDTEDLEFWEQIAPAYGYRPELLPYVYATKDGHHAIDHLRMFAAIRERMMTTGNNCFFYSQIGQYPNINIQGDEPVAEGEREATAATLKEVNRKIKAERQRVERILRQDLEERPEVVIHAYFLHAGKSKDRHATKWLMAMAGNLITEAEKEEAAIYLQANAEHFRQRWYKAVIRRFLRLYFAGVEDNIRHEWMEASHQDFQRQWHGLTAYLEIMLYNNRRHRKMMTPHHQAEVHFRKFARKWIVAAAPDGVIRSDTLTDLLNTKAKRLKLSAALDAVEEHPVAILTKSEAEKMLFQLFDVEEETFHGFKEYTFKEMEVPPLSGSAPPAILNNPLRYLDLFH